MDDPVARFIDWYETGFWAVVGDYAPWALMFSVGLLILTAGVIGIHSHRRKKGGE